MVEMYLNVYWFQESKTDKDEEICKKVNDLLNNPPTPGSNRGGGLSDLQASDLANLGLLCLFHQNSWC